ncbi:hypothetical protein ACIOZM_12210 [Pseudomonas sp. NPDC087346]|uniref:hypothetical protein n=1 Tax=Pseudomonas sp. NPDC087346 TaxID=3364438 RepID=UPI0038268FDA
MRIYRVVWAVFMFSVVAPGFLLASATELQTFSETVISARNLLHGYHAPSLVMDLLGYPIAIMATILPGSSTLLPFLGEMIWENVGVFLLGAALLNVEPPFYKREAEELEHAAA